PVVGYGEAASTGEGLRQGTFTRSRPNRTQGKAYPGPRLRPRTFRHRLRLERGPVRRCGRYFARRVGPGAEAGRGSTGRRSSALLYRGCGGTAVPGRGLRCYFLHANVRALSSTGEVGPGNVSRLPTWWSLRRNGHESESCMGLEIPFGGDRRGPSRGVSSGSSGFGPSPCIFARSLPGSSPRHGTLGSSSRIYHAGVQPAFHRGGLRGGGGDFHRPPRCFLSRLRQKAVVRRLPNALRHVLG